MTKRLAAALAANRHLRGPRVLYRDDGKTVARATVSRSIQELAGHESLTTTQRYMHLSPAVKDAGSACWTRRAPSI